MSTRLWTLVLFGSLNACREAPGDAPARASARDTAPAPASPDRLPPGELLESAQKVFGLPVPRGMQLDAQFIKTAHLVGPVSPQLLADYIRQRVLVSHVEMAARKIIFPKVTLRGDASARPLRIELLDEGARSHLIIKDLTAPAPLQGLNEAERWKRAGMRPNGELIDPQNLE